MPPLKRRKKSRGISAPRREARLVPSSPATADFLDALYETKPG